jgi:hypothetical protein
MPEALTRYYIVTLGLYRALYIPNWIWRYVLSHIKVMPDLNACWARYQVEGMVDPIAVVGGVFQTCLNFYFIVYLRKYPRERDIEYPAETLPPPITAGGPSPEAQETLAAANTPEAPNVPEVANALKGLAPDAPTPLRTTREPERQKTVSSSYETPVGVKAADSSDLRVLE